MVICPLTLYFSALLLSTLCPEVRKGEYESPGYKISIRG